MFIFRIILIYKLSKTSHFDNRSYSCIQAVDESNCNADNSFIQKNRHKKRKPIIKSMIEVTICSGVT